MLYFTLGYIWTEVQADDRFEAEKAKNVAFVLTLYLIGLNKSWDIYFDQTAEIFHRVKEMLYFTFGYISKLKSNQTIGFEADDQCSY